MALGVEQQFVEGIKRSNYVLITFRKNFDADSVSSALALGLVLKKMNIAYDIVCDHIHIPEHLLFLPEANTIGEKLEELQKLIISIDLKDNEVDQFSYDIKDNRLNIYVTPKFIPFEKDHIRSEFTPYKYDLICVLDSPDFESLGKIYEQQIDFFKHTPVYNIDCHPSNEHFGQVNIVNMNASATAEVLFTLIRETGIEWLDETVATCLLTGIVSKTKSLTSKIVTPKTLETAKQLMEMGADRGLIVNHLYRNKSVPTINLWGRVMARLKTDIALGIAWSLISENDFIESATTEKNLEGIVEEFIKDIPDIEIMILLYQKSRETQVVVSSVHQREEVLSLVSDYKPQGTKFLCGFSLQEMSLIDAEKKVISDIQEKIRRRPRR